MPDETTINATETVNPCKPNPQESVDEVIETSQSIPSPPVNTDNKSREKCVFL